MSDKNETLLSIANAGSLNSETGFRTLQNLGNIVNQDNAILSAYELIQEMLLADENGTIVLEENDKQSLLSVQSYIKEYISNE